MIYLDPRAGSIDLAPHLPNHTQKRLLYGDVAFTGSGPDPTTHGPLSIGIEVKTVPDVVQCIHTGRFAAHQLPGMHNLYHHVYLLILNRIDSDQNGCLRYHSGKGHWLRPYAQNDRYLNLSDFVHWLHTMNVQGGCNIWFADGYKAAGKWLAFLHDWWAKDWEKHKSLKTLNTVQDHKHVSFIRPSTRRKIAAQLPGIGWERAGAIAKHFDSVLEMALASESEWQKVDGVGKKLAKEIVKELT